jgi:hypothetical protein
VKDHVQGLVKPAAKDKEQQRASLLEGLILLKQLQMYTVNPTDLSPMGCVSAWYQQLSGVNNSGIAEYYNVEDDEMASSNNMIDIGSMDVVRPAAASTAASAAAAMVKVEASTEVADHDVAMTDARADVAMIDVDQLETSATAASTVPPLIVWTGPNCETYAGAMVDGVFHHDGNG